MTFLEKIKSIFSSEELTEDEIRQEKKDSINNLTEGNDYLNDRVNKLFDMLDD